MNIENALDAFNKLSPLIAIAIVVISHGQYVTQSEFYETKDEISSRLTKVERSLQKICSDFEPPAKKENKNR